MTEKLELTAQSGVQYSKISDYVRMQYAICIVFDML